MATIDFVSVPDPSHGYPERKRRVLGIDVGHLCEALTESDRREMLGYLLEDGAIVTAVCQAVSGTAQGVENHLGLDLWFTDDLREKVRSILAPMLGAAVKESLDAAVAQAEKCAKAHNTLRSLVHIDAMIVEERIFDGRSPDRLRQYRDEFESAKSQFPEYHAKADETLRLYNERRKAAELAGGAA